MQIIPAEEKVPESPRNPVLDSYHGVNVVDEYRWLEDPRDPQVIKWTETQNRFTQEYLSHLPAKQAIEKRLKELYSKIPGTYYGAEYDKGQVFFAKFKPPKQQPFLVAFDSESKLDAERIVFDPNDFDPSGQTSVDWYVVSPDARMVAICLSKGGSEDGNVHLFKIENGDQVDQIIPRVNFPTGGGSLAWVHDSSGFYYTRYPLEGEKSKEDLNFYQKVYFHKLGDDSSSDKFVLCEDLPRIAEVSLDSSKEGHYILATVANGDGGEFSHYFLAPNRKWKKISQFEDKLTRAEFGRNDEMYIISKKEDPKGTILRLSLPDPNLASAKTIIRAREGSIEGFVASSKLILVAEVVGGPSKIFAYDLQGKLVDEIPLEPLSSVSELCVTGEKLLFQSQSYITPPEWLLYDPKTKQTKPTALRFDFPEMKGYDVVREFAESKDGTMIPLNIIKGKETKLDGTNPVLLNGYGGYGLSMKPGFNLRRTVFLEQGGIVVIASLRGGGEFGEEWHRAGMKTKKQNVFDDFLACASHLIQRGYTRPDKLAIEGGSNGGLLMGAALTQAPDLFKAVVSHVGIYDMLRVELDPNGAFNVTEFGTVREPDQFRALYSYSPYHHVRDGTQYPAVFFTAGENDGRVNASHSRKMAALLQRASSSGKPVLLRTSSSGHGFGTAFDERVAEDSAVFAFLFDQLGIDYKPRS